MKLSHDYFMKEYHSFRAIMCSTAHTPEQKQEAWAGLLYCYMNCSDKKDKDVRQGAMAMLMVEFPMRLGMELSAKLEKLLDRRK